MTARWNDPDLVGTVGREQPDDDHQVADVWRIERAAEDRHALGTRGHHAQQRTAWPLGLHPVGRKAAGPGNFHMDRRDLQAVHRWKSASTKTIDMRRRGIDPAPPWRPLSWESEADATPQARQPARAARNDPGMAVPDRHGCAQARPEARRGD